MLAKLIAPWSRAARESGRPLAAIVLEALRLRRGVGQLGFSEYLDFGLYRSDLDAAQKSAFGGWRAQGVLEEILADDYSRFLSLDKITMYTLLAGYGLPIPRLRAVYGSPRPAVLPFIATPAALADFLRSPGALPLYLKPSLGAYGRGNTLVRARAGEGLELGDGSTVPVDAFCASLDDPHGLGWILQEPLTPDRHIAEICGDKISGVRIHTFLARGGPVITKAIWKISIGREDSDNFRHGASGNLLAAVDPASGTVLRVIAGTGFGQRVDPPHPVSGKPLVGFALPHWPAIADLVRQAAQAFPGFLCPGWDIAICDDGPRILEVNFFGDIDLSQHAYRQGFLDPAFVALLRERGLDGLLRGPAGEREQSPKNGRWGRRSHHWDW